MDECWDLKFVFDDKCNHWPGGGVRTEVLTVMQKYERNAMLLFPGYLGINCLNHVALESCLQLLPSWCNSCLLISSNGNIHFEGICLMIHPLGTLNVCIKIPWQSIQYLLRYFCLDQSDHIEPRFHHSFS